MKQILFILILLGYTSAASAFETEARNAVVIDAATNVTLFEKEADAVMYPASMTKMMTAYMMFESLKNGTLSLQDTYPVSEAAWRKGGSKMFVQLGTEINIQDLMRGIIIQSGNDACIVFAEGFAGSEERFAERMTKKAHELGMTNSVFKNATGWPDEEHVTTARDLALLADRTIKDFPEYYSLYGESEFHYNNITQRNRNMLLARNIGVDGLKTGHTEAAGYGITISGEREGRRVHVVVGGLASEKQRADEAEKLYRFAFNEFRHLSAGQKPLGTVPLWYGIKDEIAVTTGGTLVVPIVDKDKATLTFITDTSLSAPIEKGQKIGIVELSFAGITKQSVPMLAAESVMEAGIIKRLITNIKALTSGS